MWPHNEEKTSFAEDSVIANRRFLVSFLLTSAMALGQVAGGSLTGTVTDSGGGPAAGITVKAQSERTGRPYMAVTSSAGTYVFPDLNSGAYTISAEKPGSG